MASSFKIFIGAVKVLGKLLSAQPPMIIAILVKMSCCSFVSIDFLFSFCRSINWSTFFTLLPISLTSAGWSNFGTIFLKVHFLSFLDKLYITNNFIIRNQVKEFESEREIESDCWFGENVTGENDTSVYGRAGVKTEISQKTAGGNLEIYELLLQLFAENSKVLLFNICVVVSKNWRKTYFHLNIPHFRIKGLPMHSYFYNQWLPASLGMRWNLT